MPIAAAEVTAKNEWFQDEVLSATGALKGYALRLTRNVTAAEDLVQETLLRAWSSLDSFTPGTPDSNFRGWLYRIMHNAYIDDYRRSKKHPEDCLGDIEDSFFEGALPSSLLHQYNPERIIMDTALNLEIESALKKVPPVFRRPLLMFAVGDTPYQEISERLNIPVGTTRSRIYRARGHLLKTLGANGNANGAKL